MLHFYAALNERRITRKDEIFFTNISVSILSEKCLVISTRSRHSVNPVAPKMPTWKRKKMLAFAAPKFTENFQTTEHLWEECPREIEMKSKVQGPNAFEQLYVNEMIELLSESKMVAFYHINAVDENAKRKVK